MLYTPDTQIASSASPRDIAHWRERLILRRELSDADVARTQRHVREGSLVVVTRGVYTPSSEWKALSHDEQYRALVYAVAILEGSDAVFSHSSAAALWRLPWVGSRDPRIHVVGGRTDGGRSNSAVFRHSAELPDEVVPIDGVLATGLARTVVDVARTSSFGQAVVVADAALRRSVHPMTDLPHSAISRSALDTELHLVPPRHGRKRALRVLSFADARADSPGESLSRVGMHEAGLTRPRLQETLRGASGREWTVDFWWPHLRLIGEFDGEVKYSDPAFLAGRTPKQALRDEKVREDDLRATGLRMTRWGWDLALHPWRLRDHLVSAGLR